jgi:hypothetical protein
MATIKKELRKVEVTDIDTQKFLFNLSIHETDENNVRGYIATKANGEEICRKFYMDYLTLLQVKANIKKYIRENHLL